MVDTVKIGNVEPLSGPSASFGQQGKKAREMAVEEINAAGGIKSLGGAKLELIYADSKSDPNVGVTETERLINTDKVNIVTGCWNSGVTYPATAVAERYGVPFVVPVSVRDTITERGFKYVFRIAAKDSWWTRDQFTFLKDMKTEFNSAPNSRPWPLSTRTATGAPASPPSGRNWPGSRLRGRPRRTLPVHPRT
jgi:branched-chain amino acid transport system substrate-binding protein